MALEMKILMCAMAAISKKKAWTLIKVLLLASPRPISIYSMPHLHTKHHIYLIHKYVGNKPYRIKSCFHNMHRYEK